MTLIAPTLQAFFTDRLQTQRQASAATVAAYRDSFRLLLRFVAERTSKTPSALDFNDLDAPTIGAFLTSLEQDRGNTVRTRNARLAGIHSFFRYAALTHPEHAGTIQRVLAIPQKRFERAIVGFLTAEEARALLKAPNENTWIGRRDQTLLAVAIQTGLRVTELTTLHCADVTLNHGAHIRCQGKGRKERSTPLTTSTTEKLRSWMTERNGDPTDPLFPSRRGTTLSTDAVEALVKKYAHKAGDSCSSIAAKNVTPHVLRHSAAMFLREAGVDISVIALWLGHENIASTQIYLHADLAIKEKALAMTAQPTVPPGRYHPSDRTMAFLEAL